MSKRLSPLASNAWQIHCTGELQRCVAMGELMGATEWNVARKGLIAEARQRGVDPARIVIADCNLGNARLRRWRFDHCYLARVDLTDADLRGANFDRAILRKCRLVRADLRGAEFLRTSIDDGTLGWAARIDHRTMLACTGSADGLAGFDPLVRRRAAEDQRIHNMRALEWGPARAWYEIIDYGRSISRLVLIAAVLVSVFSLAYASIYAYAPAHWEGGPWSWTDFLFLSAAKFINVSATIDSKSQLPQALFLFESMVGYAFLALLAATLVRKLMILE